MKTTRDVAAYVRDTIVDNATEVGAIGRLEDAVQGTHFTIEVDGDTFTVLVFVE
jgi:hypothetical protein